VAHRRHRSGDDGRHDRGARCYYPGGLFTLFAQGDGPNVADETYARTMAFTTLMMFQLFNVYNCRSPGAAPSGVFENKWLIAAVVDCRCSRRCS
jgi:hypothetical protein